MIYLICEIIYAMSQSRAGVGFFLYHLVKFYHKMCRVVNIFSSS